MKGEKNMYEMAVLAALGGFVVVMALISIAFYVVVAIGRFKYLQVRGYQNAWMAFIPIANHYACVEATYGPVNYINLYGWRAPSVVLKLWTVITYALSFVVSYIPFVGFILSIALTVLNVAVLVQIFKDEMERLEEPQTTGFAVLANIISIIAGIKLLTASGKFVPGSQNWTMDQRILTSQTVLDGPLSFMNGSNNASQTVYTQPTYTAQQPVQPAEPVEPETPVQGFSVDKTTETPDLSFGTDTTVNNTDQDQQ